MIATLRRYWAWWIALLWLGAYELWALGMGGTTLSRMVWEADRALPALAWIVTGAAVILLVHFFWPFLSKPFEKPGQNPRWPRS